MSIERFAIGAIVAGVIALFLFVPKARSAEYEIYAERASGALLREDEQNSHRLRDKDEEPFASREDCVQAIKGVRLDSRLRYQSGWKLMCRPVDVPTPRMVVR